MKPPSNPAVVFDLGGVLADWNPRHLYSKLIEDPAELERFLSEVVPLSWNHHLDLGEPFEQLVELRAEEFPEHATLVKAYWERWPEMFGGPIEGTVELLAALRDRGVPLYLLTNSPESLVSRVSHTLDYWDWFDGHVVSAHERLAKPDPAIWELLCDRFGLDPTTTVFIDDNEANVVSATEFGLDAILFTGPANLRLALAERGLLH